MRTMMTSGTMMSMIKNRRILSSTLTTNNMRGTDYSLKTMELTIFRANMIMMTSLKMRNMTIRAAKRMKVLMTSKGRMRKATMILAIWAVKRMNTFMMTSTTRMMIALAAGKMRILMTTSQTLETALKLKFLIR